MLSKRLQRKVAVGSGSGSGSGSGQGCALMFARQGASPWYTAVAVALEYKEVTRWPRRYD
jgi:NAD(P)-dependent dehydrogenase (short-subunit alcohol dehydrogenase family)